MENNSSAVLYEYGNLPKWEAKKLPQITDDQVLIELQASTINPSDLLFIDGNYFRQPLPNPCGFQGVGKVVKAGKNKQDLVGKRVTFGNISGGAWSNYAIASQLVFPIDADVPVSSAASGFVNPFTALGFIHQIKAKGHHGLIHTAAASALGRMVNKLCIKQKFDLINLVRRQEQADLLKSEGAEHVIVTTGNWVQELKQLIEKLQIKVFFDALGGGETQGQILKLLPTDGGRAYIYGALQGKPTQISCVNLIGGLVITGFLVGIWLKSITAEQRNGLLLKYNDYLKNELYTSTSKQFKLDQILEALQYYKQNMTKGKILLRP